MGSLLSLALLWAFHGGQADDGEPQVEARRIIRSIDHGADRCLNGLVGFSLTMRCKVGAEGRADDCAVLNPTAATRRNDRVFQCMAAKMRFTYPDGSAAAGRTVQFRLNGRTWQTDVEYDRARNGQPQRQ